MRSFPNLNKECHFKFKLLFMKILQLITLSELGGAQSVVINLSNALCAEHEVIVAAGEGDGKMWETLDKKVKKHQCLHLQRAISLTKDLLALNELWQIYKLYKPDVIHLHSSKAGLLGRIVFPSDKIVYTVHGFDTIRVAHRRLLPIEKIMQYFCHSIVGVSKYDYENLIAEGITRNVSYIYNGISQPDSTEISKPKVFDKYDKIILAIARVSPQKKHDIFIEVSRMLPQFGFIWIGNQLPVDNVPPNCHFIGNIHNAGAYCKYADLFCLPSNYEGLPMVILEAMSFAKPIIASNVGGIQEIVHDENGCVIPNDPQIFANKIEFVLSDNIRLNQMGANSKKIFEEKLTVDKMVNGYLKHYNEIFKGKIKQ